MNKRILWAIIPVVFLVIYGAIESMPELAAIAGQAPAAVDTTSAGGRGEVTRPQKLAAYQEIQTQLGRENPNEITWPALTIRPDHVTVAGDTARVSSWADFKTLGGALVRKDVGAVLVGSGTTWRLVNIHVE